MQNNIPKYEKIEIYLKNKISSGELKVDDVIPSEPELSKKFEVSRMTARKAVDKLVNEELVYRIKGKGTFVKHKKLNRKGLKSFSEDMKNKGMSPSSKLIKFEIIDTDIQQSEFLNCEIGTKIYRIERVMMANDEPMAYEIIYRDINITPGLTEEDFDNKSVYKQLADLNIIIDHSDQQIGAILAEITLADLLDITVKSPVLLIKSLTYSNKNELVQFTKSYYRADRYAFDYQTYKK